VGPLFTKSTPISFPAYGPVSYINDKVDAVDHQFGFKSGHSASLCTYSFKRVVDYTNRESHVFVCCADFADFSKAFDKVNYWKLFRQLIDLGSSTWIVSLFAYWYIVIRKYV